MLWRSRCTHDLYNVEGVGHTMDGKVIPPSKKLATRSMHHFLSPLLSPVWKRLRVVHKRSKYSSQDIHTCIVFKFARFQCLNFSALPIFQTHCWIYLVFDFQFTSLHYDYQNMCVYVCFWNCFFFSLLFSFVWKLLHLYKNRINSKVCVTCITNVFRKKSWFFSWFLFSPHLDF